MLLQEPSMNLSNMAIASGASEKELNKGTTLDTTILFLNALKRKNAGVKSRRINKMLPRLTSLLINHSLTPLISYSLISRCLVLGFGTRDKDQCLVQGLGTRMEQG